MKLRTPANIKKETEKAIMIDVTIDTPVKRIGRDLWFPKSAIKSEDGKVIEIADWILSKKEDEVANTLPAGAFYGFIF